MIRIQKPKDIIPKKLLEDGKAQTTKDKRSFSRNPSKEYSSKNNFSFDSKIYGDASVKSLLRQIQFDKCCYCESKVDTYNADVEHFRPKAYSRQSKNNKPEYPGYYWLAYDWTNLYLSCATCNRSYKKNYFPLLNPEERARSHKENIHLEKPFLIDPCIENPEEFIAFRGDIPYGKDLLNRGYLTIQYLGLDRDELCEARLEKLKILKLLYSTIETAKQYPDDELLQRDAEESKQLIDKYTSEQGEFLAAIRCAMSTNFEFVD
jgi:uncharacterized protein (TIGR02646 family)